ncbi:hypothetical protein ACHAXT_010292 [Thalassiosira profunda]
MGGARTGGGESRPSDNIVFGALKSSGPDDHVDNLWSSKANDELSAVKKAVLEARSKVSRQQPSYPEFMNDPQYRHGSDGDAQQLLYADCGTNDENAENNYIRSHGAYKPGEQQKRRDYQWPAGQNPDSTVFGIKGENNATGSSAGVAEALQIRDDCETRPDAARVGKTYDQEKIFGKSTASSNSSAADCLVHDARDDTGGVDDLGKSLTPGFRNASTERTFGCPSIRTDIPKYERASVADKQSYGDDVNAGYLLRPSLLSSFGLEEDEFHKPRSKAYLRKLFQSCGMNIDDDLFEDTFRRVADERGLASIESMRKAYEQK